MSPSMSPWDLIEHPLQFQTRPAAPESAREPSLEESADYIGQMAAELAKIAKTSHLELIAYFLEMAQQEAETIAQK